MSQQTVDGDGLKRMAERSQRFAHDQLHLGDDPKGWDTQRDSEPIVNVGYPYTRRLFSIFFYRRLFAILHRPVEKGFTSGFPDWRENNACRHFLRDLDDRFLFLIHRLKSAFGDLNRESHRSLLSFEVSF
jgi:hypothetical protein